MGADMKLGIFASAFDPFPHPGHLWAMQQALDAGACDGVLAAVQVDPQIERPEKRKPALTLAERKMILESIRYVKQVLFYRTEQDLWTLIYRLKPACLIVGEDHQLDRVTGADIATVFWAKRKPEWSGTEFSRRIHDAYRAHQERNPDAQPPRQSVPGPRDPTADRGVQVPGVPGVR
jgi:glycerol-3-phosphate cytidylyltransferase